MPLLLIPQSSGAGGATAPAVSTVSVTSIGPYTATGNGNVSSDGGSTILERGIQISLDPTFATGVTAYPVTGTTGAYAAALSGLRPNTTFYVRAYARNAVGTSYGAVISFLTAVFPSVLKKTYIYRVFMPGSAGGYVTTWTKEVVSEPEFVTNVNGFPGELDVTLARPFDDFGEGADVALNNRVEMWCIDVDAPNGVLVYQGYIADYLPLIDGQNGTAESVTIVLLSYGGELDRNILRDAAGNTTITYTTTDPVDILQDAVAKYQAVGGVLKVTAASL